MTLDEMLHYREAQPGSAGFARPPTVSTIKSLEDARKMLRTDSGTRVAHGKNELVCLAHCRDRDVTLPGVTDRVLHEIGDYLK